MAYIELGNVCFRGQLLGATGTFSGSLTADAIDAVDTVNIKGGAVTYSLFTRYTNKSVTKDIALLNMTVNIPDTNAYVEVLAQADRGGGVYIDEVLRPIRNFRTSANLAFPFIETILLPKGVHEIKVLAASTGVSSYGLLSCRYIRRTGSANA